MPGEHHVFISYNSADRPTAALLYQQLTWQGFTVFWDVESLRAGELWLERLQQEVDGCGAFVLLVGRDGVRRWVGAEAQAALIRFFGPQDDDQRLPIFPVLLDGSAPEALPAYLRLFQATRWDGAGPLPEDLLAGIRKGALLSAPAIPFEGCPFVGLSAYRPEQAHLFFGRQKETLNALTCFFDVRPSSQPVRWLEINGNSGSGKSSLMQAGLLPLVDKGWLWRPHWGYERWRRIGPMMPGEHPMEMLAEHLARTFGTDMNSVCEDLQAGDRALARWLRGRRPDDETAFLLAIDQFEELFTVANRDERIQFDRLLAMALEDVDCPLFVISTVRADFLDCFEDMPRLVAVRNSAGRSWTLAPIGAEGLREVIAGPARLANLDVSEVKEAMVDQARDEPGALPLVENALHWLWQRRAGNRLQGQLFTEHGGIAGILSGNADALLAGLDKAGQDCALELLFRLVQVDPEARRHTRRRIPLPEAIDIAGGGKRGQTLVDHLAGQRGSIRGTAKGPLRLIAITDEAGSRWVNLIHETLIRSKGIDTEGNPLPYWPTLWTYIEQHNERAAWLDRLKADTQIWIENQKRPSDLWSHERVREAVIALTQVGPELQLSDNEREFLGPIDAPSMLAELERPDTPHRRRALIGERLDILGDPRPCIGVEANGTPKIDWCPIEGGEVTVRARPDCPLSRTIKRFKIARYPITVAQYRAFLQAEDGWLNIAWWADDLFRDPDGRTYEFGRFNNHPAVYVSWFDSMAFCRWLTRRLGFDIRLPDEWEWQQAATGGHFGNVFPWGNGWNPKQEPQRANTFESLLGRTTAVGMYPDGASSAGVLDMAGTVWEWCLNKLIMPEIHLSRTDDFEPRVLRGGRWSDHCERARSTYREGRVPYYRYDSIGFRVISLS